MTVLLWYKRDLRVRDHPALGLAAAMGERVVPVYVVEPEYWALPDTSGRQWAFTRECLESLSDDLARLGAPLVVRVGDAVEQLAAMVAAYGVTRIVSHEETGNLWTYRRDQRVAAWARLAGLEWREVAQSGVVRCLAARGGRNGWARQRDGFVFAPIVPAPRALPPLEHIGGRVPDVGLKADPCPDRQKGGCGEAERLLESFLNERGRKYRGAMSSPLEGEWACSRLSAHIALGAVSIREVAQATAARQRAVRGRRDGWGGSLRSFQSRLAWRDHFIQKLEDEPRVEVACLHRAYESLRPRESDPARLCAWSQGETGLPFVDACMRFLRATGWLNFRMRSMVMAVASYHLWLDWRSTGPVLARLFTDYEPGIHWSQVQMQSGTTGMNTIRIYNPVKQGRDQDPAGVFTRRWVPELAGVPDVYLQEPWKWVGAGQLAYPAPVVDVTNAARAAREAVWAVRKGTGHNREARRIVEKHASRKAVSGKSRARAKADDRQLGFEF